MLSHKEHYLQIAINSNIHDGLRIVSTLPPTRRILIEAGTPLIKQEGANAIRQLNHAWTNRLLSAGIHDPAYIVADMKCMDRGEREVDIAASGGASAAIALGQAPVETLNAFIAACHERDMDSMVDMMNVEKPYQILRKLKVLPTVVILHRGVDEEQFSDKPLPIHQINKIKGAFNTLVSIAGGDTPREIQSAAFNGADIIVVWKNFYQAGGNTSELAEEFLATIK
ncbi:orotidine 5'-phosphate decarboxylase [Candidatus Roizmanbacteria bacterium]|nr:orotidine 5'-phosphate decarboxylase [Candidatus Roizmanbacteria bacterium]